MRPYINVVDYGGFGSGKSELASTFPGPNLLFSSDPRGKEAPYLRRGELGESGEEDLGVSQKGGHLILPYQNVMHPKTGDLLIRIEYMHEEFLEFDDDDPDKVTGWQVLPKLRRRLGRL